MRIALISDIHYGELATCPEFALGNQNLKTGNVDSPNSLLKGITDILKKEKPEYLLIAGDLTSRGSPLEFKYCYKMIEKLGEDIGVDPSKILFCIGNHDVDWEITSISDKFVVSDKEDRNYVKKCYQSFASQVATRVLKDQVSQKLCPNYRDAWSAPFSGVMEYDNCVVFVLNSGHLSARNQEYKHGALTTEQINWFAGVAKKYQKYEKFKLVLLHHHPFNYPNYFPGLDISTLEEGANLCDICGKNGIPLVLHGHRHQPGAKTRMESGWKNTVTFICAGSLSVDASERAKGEIPNTFHLIDCSGPREILLKNYSYSMADGWSPTIYSTATPVDGIMRLGKVTDPESIKELIQKLPCNQQISIDDLDSMLQLLTYRELKAYIEEIHGMDTAFFLPQDTPKSVYICKEV